ncbi:MAG: inositol monophosphatase [Bacteroidetes bacterium HGW-Bacteroidetes-17]|nr:MAG: inositol monophosphatase [Bacteroidetes bacterium HGW-Bacteroidetes-17]
MNLKIITNQVCNLARAVGKFIQVEAHQLRSADIEFKGIHNLVTYVDKIAEERLITELAKLIPESGFIAEESPKLETKAEFNWIIDPLDGTTNFIHGVPVYCISIALEYKSEIILGVVYEINRDECFYSWKGERAFLNNKLIHVSQSSNLDDSLLATGFPYYDYGRLDEYLQLFKYFMQHTRGVRRLGSAAADLAYVACGRFDGFYEYGLQSWDVAAGSFIVAQAGGMNTDFSGNSNYIFGKEIISTNTLLNQELLSVIKHYFA